MRARQVVTRFVAGAVGLALWIGVAGAQGINLSWDDCGVAGSMDKTYDCGSSQGAVRLVGSFAAPAGVDRLGALEVSVTAFRWGYPLSPWWDMVPGGCRGAAWTFDFADPGEHCVPFIGATRFVGQFADAPAVGAIRFRGAVALQEPVAVTPGVELYAFTLVLRHQGADACDGCCLPMCIELGWVSLLQEGQPKITFSQWLDSGWVTWQGGSCAVRAGSGRVSGNGCLQTPARASTWGAIKALYR